MAKNIIKLNRGDSYEFNVRIPDLTDKDVVYFALLYPHQCFEDAILIKGYEYTDINIDNENIGDLLIKIEPKDTGCLASGTYYYTVKLYRGGSLLNAIDNFSEPEEIRTIIERM